MQGGEILLFGIYPFEKLIAAHTLVAYLAILYGIVVADHIYIKKVFYLRKRYYGMLGKPCGAAQVGILARKGKEIHIILRFMFGVVGCQGNDAGCTRSIIVGTCIEDFLA